MILVIFVMLVNVGGQQPPFMGPQALREPSWINLRVPLPSTSPKLYFAYWHPMLLYQRASSNTLE